MTKLKPCPFCGSNKVKVDSFADHGFFMSCGMVADGDPDCRVYVICDTEQEAIDIWNKRVDDGANT